MRKRLLIGAHLSIAGGVYNAVYKGEKIGATTIQIFTGNQKQWSPKKINDEDIQLWHQAIKNTKMSHVMSHASYLVNLGSPKQELLQKSRAAFRQEISRCHLLDLEYLNFHPGSATQSSEEECLHTIIESLLSLEDLATQGPTRLLLETTAGQGTQVGHKFEHLDFIISNVKTRIPIGVCIDTCHIFAAGYDIRSSSDWEEVLKQFDHIVGLEHLYAFHLNDSMKELGSRKDRHANLGKGQIGLESFQFLMQSPLTQKLPFYLETPNGDTTWPEEIQLLKSFAKQKKVLI